MRTAATIFLMVSNQVIACSLLFSVTNDSSLSLPIRDRVEVCATKNGSPTLRVLYGLKGKVIERTWSAAEHRAYVENAKSILDEAVSSLKGMPPCDHPFKVAFKGKTNVRTFSACDSEPVRKLHDLAQVLVYYRG